MKILFHHLVPFSFAHGGQQIQIEQTKHALEQVGVEVEFLRWWDDAQTGDILHSFCRLPIGLLHMAHAKGMKVVLADLLTEQETRARARASVHKKFFRKLFPAHFPAPSSRLSIGKLIAPPMPASHSLPTKPA